MVNVSLQQFKRGILTQNSIIQHCLCGQKVKFSLFGYRHYLGVAKD